jgi:hypothetical protein
MRVFILLFLFQNLFVKAQIHSYYLQNKTPEYAQVIRFYDSISKKTPYFKLIRGATTDAGIPLQLLVISRSKNFDPVSIHRQKKTVLIINNGIHPGEPDGIDACINMVRNYALHPETIPDNVVICIVPVFNIDGALQRNSVMRMNQNGPLEFGFRGNAKNLDLNRDFVKCDASNTRSIIQFIRQWNPEVFVDTHVSNGADYPYTMTLIYPNSSKVYGDNKHALFPSFFSAEVKARAAQKGWDVCPYVESVEETPDSGLYEFNQTPRYSTGYASLFHCLSFVTESHMLKPYRQRVEATLSILNAIIELSNEHTTELAEWKKNRESDFNAAGFGFVNWRTDETRHSAINFKGYWAQYKKSEISGKQRLFYNRDAVWEKEIPYYNYFVADTILKPKYYVISKAWREVVDVLKLNRVNLIPLAKDSLMEVEVDYITDFKSVAKPYEGHYLHHSVKTRKEIQRLKYFRGDYLIPVNQFAGNYLIETLEPTSNDGFFAWNFFDAVLQQKEGFSDYVFEEVAEQILQENPIVQHQLDSARAVDINLRENHWQQLNFVFQHSRFKEKSHNRYPIARIFRK